MKLSPNQQEVLDVLSGRNLLRFGQRRDQDGWINAGLFNTITVRSLVRRGLVEISDNDPRRFMDDLSIRLATTTEQEK